MDCLGKVGSCRTYTRIDEGDNNEFSEEYNPDLYGGKRGGFGFESAELADGAGPSDAFKDESNMKFIMNEFKKRKGKASIPKGKREQVDIHTGFPDDCPLDDPGSKAVPKLGWRVRLACYSQLKEVLETNHVNGYIELRPQIIYLNFQAEHKLRYVFVMKIDQISHLISYCNKIYIKF